MRLLILFIGFLVVGCLGASYDDDSQRICSVIFLSAFIISTYLYQINKNLKNK